MGELVITDRIVTIQFIYVSCYIQEDRHTYHAVTPIRSTVAALEDL